MDEGEWCLLGWDCLNTVHEIRLSALLYRMVVFMSLLSPQKPQRRADVSHAWIFLHKFTALYIDGRDSKP